jgi:hypothetical protein
VVFARKLAMDSEEGWVFEVTNSRRDMNSIFYYESLVSTHIILPSRVGRYNCGPAGSCGAVDAAVHW